MLIAVSFACMKFLGTSYFGLAAGLFWFRGLAILMHTEKGYRLRPSSSTAARDIACPPCSDGIRTELLDAGRRHWLVTPTLRLPFGAALAFRFLSCWGWGGLPQQLVEAACVHRYAHVRHLPLPSAVHRRSWIPHPLIIKTTHTGAHPVRARCTALVRRR